MTISATNIKGSFCSPNLEGVTLQIKSTTKSAKIVRLDKDGRFILKKVDLDNDTILIKSPSFRCLMEIPAAFPIDSSIEYDLKIKELNDGLQVSYIPKQIGFESVFGGLIVGRENLEKTGFQYVLEAIRIKFPQKSFSTFNGSLTPLYFVDGVEVMSIDDIPIKEIAYVEYLSPGNVASASLGSRGANGAILLTTNVKFETSPQYRQFSSSPVCVVVKCSE